MDGHIDTGVDVKTYILDSHFEYFNSQLAPIFDLNEREKDTLVAFLNGFLIAANEKVGQDISKNLANLFGLDASDKQFHTKNLDPFDAETFDAENPDEGGLNLFYKKKNVGGKYQAHIAGTQIIGVLWELYQHYNLQMDRPHWRTAYATVLHLIDVELLKIPPSNLQITDVQSSTTDGKHNGLWRRNLLSNQKFAVLDNPALEKLSDYIVLKKPDFKRTVKNAMAIWDQLHSSLDHDGDVPQANFEDDSQAAAETKPINRKEYLLPLYDALAICQSNLATFYSDSKLGFKTNEARWARFKQDLDYAAATEDDEQFFRITENIFESIAQVASETAHALIDTVVKNYNFQENYDTFHELEQRLQEADEDLRNDHHDVYHEVQMYEDFFVTARTLYREGTVPIDPRANVYEERAQAAAAAEIEAAEIEAAEIEAAEAAAAAAAEAEVRARAQAAEAAEIEAAAAEQARVVAEERARAQAAAAAAGAKERTRGVTIFVSINEGGNLNGFDIESLEAVGGDDKCLRGIKEVLVRYYLSHKTNPAFHTENGVVTVVQKGTNPLTHPHLQFEVKKDGDFVLKTYRGVVTCVPGKQPQPSFPVLSEPKPEPKPAGPVENVARVFVMFNRITNTFEGYNTDGEYTCDNDMVCHKLMNGILPQLQEFWFRHRNAMQEGVVAADGSKVYTAVQETTNAITHTHLQVMVTQAGNSTLQTYRGIVIMRIRDAIIARDRMKIDIANKENAKNYVTVRMPILSAVSAGDGTGAAAGAGIGAAAGTAAGTPAGIGAAAGTAAGTGAGAAAVPDTPLYLDDTKKMLEIRLPGENSWYISPAIRMGKPVDKRSGDCTRPVDVHGAINFLRTVTRLVVGTDGREYRATERQLLREKRLQFCSVRYLGRLFQTQGPRLKEVLDTADYRILYIFLEQCCMRGGKIEKLPGNVSYGDKRNFENLWRWFFARYATIDAVGNV